MCEYLYINNYYTQYTHNHTYMMYKNSYSAND